jgi:hypothetical protein
MTIVPNKEARGQLDKTGTDLLAKMKELARKESTGDHIVQVRVTPKHKPPHSGCSCGCS